MLRKFFFHVKEAVLDETSHDFFILKNSFCLVCEYEFEG
jgi:hypothetical protein